MFTHTEVKAKTDDWKSCSTKLASILVFLEYCLRALYRIGGYFQEHCCQPCGEAQCGMCVCHPRPRCLGAGQEVDVHTQVTP